MDNLFKTCIRVEGMEIGTYAEDSEKEKGKDFVNI